MSNYNPLHLFGRSDGTEVVTQPQVAGSVAICVLVALGCGLLADWRSRRRTRAWRHSFCSSLLAVMVLVEWLYLAQLVVTPPLDVASSLIRKDCWDSTKGGKHSGNSRGCTFGEGGVCSKEEPCDPCDDPSSSSRLFYQQLLRDEFVNGYASNQGTRYKCQTCGVGGATRHCGFVPKQGPYCRRADGVVEPCFECCTERRDNRWASLYRSTCRALLEPASFNWNASGYGCPPAGPPQGSNGTGATATTEPELVLTRFGCCPASPDRGPINVMGWDGIYDLPSPSERQVECFRGGPYRQLGYGHWEGCPALRSPPPKNATTGLFLNDSAPIIGELVCPIHSNGKFVGNFCTPPVLLASL